MGCLDNPTEGSYFLEGTDITKLDPDQIAEIEIEKSDSCFRVLIIGENNLWRMWNSPLYRREKTLRNIREIAKEMLDGSV
jgi:predicted ABC-type transport system involved in lysophospholipase L1 biosynthesis ATPase subunit